MRVFRAFANWNIKVERTETWHAIEGPNVDPEAFIKRLYPAVVENGVRTEEA